MSVARAKAGGTWEFLTGLGELRKSRTSCWSGLDLNFRAPSSRPPVMSEPRFIASAIPARAQAHEIIVERRVPPHYGLLETPASSSKGMLT